MVQMELWGEIDDEVTLPKKCGKRLTVPVSKFPELTECGGAWRHKNSGQNF